MTTAVMITAVKPINTNHTDIIRLVSIPRLGLSTGRARLRFCSENRGKTAVLLASALVELRGIAPRVARFRALDGYSGGT
jgi:hypothetical protein